MSARKSAADLPIEQLTEAQAKGELARLAKAIARHRRLYYQKDAPEISDAAFDALERRNQEIEALFPHLRRSDSPSATLGAAPASGFARVEHLQPMTSLDNAFSTEEVEDFLKRARRFLNLPGETPIALMAEPKIDGLSANLLYEGGHLARGTTRGDGTVGEDITANLRTIADIPHRLKGRNVPERVEIRGEVYMTHAGFAELNRQRAAAGETIFANPRNAAAGSVRQLDAAISASRPLHFFAYGLGAIEGWKSPPGSQHALLAALRDWGFAVTPERILADKPEDAFAFYRRLAEVRADLGYDIDGVVYKIDSFALQARLGAVGRAPRWAVAHKFQAAQAITRLKDIFVNVGRTGALTPVADLEPITVGGVVISRASLHNEDELARKDIRIGDRVILQRAGDVIPQILGVVLKDRPKDARRFRFPARCPICGSHTLRETGEAVWRCTGGLVCPAQAVERLRHFVSRLAFDIEGLGYKHIERFYAEGLIKTPADIFRLRGQRALLIEREGWGELSVDNLLRAIESRRRIGLERFIYALGIPQVGEVTAKLLARHYRSFDAWRQAMLEAADESSPAHHELADIDQVGPALAAELVAFFAEAHNREALAELLREVEIEPYAAAVPADSPLAGKILVFTGTLTKMSRAEAKARAESFGAKVAGSVSAKTDFLVLGEEAGGKAKKAAALGVKTLSEDDWLGLIGRKP